MKKIAFVKGILILGAFMFTTGIIIPWVISSFVLPVWAIIITMATIALIWVLILEKPYHAIMNKVSKLRGQKDEN